MSRRVAARTAIAALAAACIAPVAARADGAALYSEHCAACHGAALEGAPDWRVQNPDGTLPPPPHDDSGHTWHHPDAMLRDYIRLGGAETLRRMGVTGIPSAMPGFGDTLSDADIEAVLNFIKSRWSPKMRAYQEQMTEESR